MEEARQNQLDLLDAGYDAYTERIYLKKKDEIWYRVRVGNFATKKKAIKIQTNIESTMNIKTWLDNLSTK